MMVPEWCGTVAGGLLMALLWLAVTGLAVWGVGRIFPTAGPAANGSPDPASSGHGPSAPERNEGRDDRLIV